MGAWRFFDSNPTASQTPSSAMSTAVSIDFDVSPEPVRLFSFPRPKFFRRRAVPTAEPTQPDNLFHGNGGESSPPRIEGGPGEGRASTRAASGARRAPAAVIEARDPSYNPNDDPMMTAVRWTNDVSSADTDDARDRRRCPWAHRRRRRAGAVERGARSTSGLETVPNRR